MIHPRNETALKEEREEEVRIKLISSIKLKSLMRFFSKQQLKRRGKILLNRL